MPADAGGDMVAAGYPGGKATTDTTPVDESTGHGSGGRRTIRSVMFAAMADAATLLDELGPERFQAVRQRYDRMVRREIGRHGGSEIKRTEDGTAAVFESAAGAIEGTAAVQAALRDARRAGDRVPEVRGGLALGECRLEDDDVFGVAVVIAARLCALADPGQVLVAETVVAAAGAPSVAVTDVVPHDLRGLDEPVPAGQLEWEGVHRGVIPLPVALRTDTTFPFVARARELAAIDGAYRRCLDGELSVALVAGEAGVGKSRLVAEAAARLHDEGAAVLFGRCDETVPVPHQPCVEWLLHLIDSTPNDELADRLGPGAADLARLVPEVAELVAGLETPASLDAEQDRQRLYRSVASWLQTLSDEWPTVLFLDDLQWAGPSTVELLAHLLDRRAVGRVLLVATRRDTGEGESSAVGDLLVKMLRSHVTTSLEVTGLATDEVRALVAGAADRDLAGSELDFIDRLTEATAGNALFVTEVLRGLVENQAITLRGSRWELDVAPGQVALPRSIAAVIDQRIDRLGPRGSEVLAAAAVLGMRFDAELLAELLDDRDEVGDLVDESVAARILVERDDHVLLHEFSHGLVHQALYGTLTRRRRRALHRAAAEALAVRLRDDTDDLILSIAHHHRAAAGNATAEAVTWSRRAAVHALDRLDHATAADLFAYVLEHMDQGDDRERLDVMIELGQSQRRAGHPAFGDTLMEAAHLALRLDDTDRIVAAALANNRGTYARAGDVDRKRVEVLRAAVDRIDEAERERALLLALLASELSWDPESDDAVQLAEEAEAIARRLDDDPVLAHVLRVTHEPLYRSRSAEQMHRRAEELVDVGCRLADPEVEFFGALWGATDALAVGDLAAASALRQRARRCADELAQPTAEWLLATREATAANAVGDFERALDFAERGLAIGLESAAPEANMVYAALQFDVLWFRGEAGDLEELVAATVEEDPGVKPFALALGAIYAQTGQPDKVAEILDQLFEGGTDTLFDGQLHHTIMISLCAELIAAVGDVDRATELLPHGQRLEGAAVGAGPAFRGSIDRSLAQLHATLGHVEEADRLFAAAVDHDEVMGVRPWEALSLIEWAEAMARDGRGGEAARRAARAGVIAEELGLTGIGDRVAALQEVHRGD